MQRGTYRVHGCARCKKRKIKCDNILPCCSQCRRLKKPCPGSTAGLIFQQAVPWIPTSGAVVTYDQRQESISRLALQMGSLNASPWTPHHWFFALPQLQLSPEFQGIVLSPLRALSIAFKALKSGDAALRSRALDYYAEGLTQQKRQVWLLSTGRLQPSSERVLPTLLVALLLLEFEMMAPLSQHSWIGHAHGAAQLLALLTPEACQVSPLFEIFWQGYMSMLTGRPSCLDQPSWRETPFLDRGKTPLDELTDTLWIDSQPSNMETRYLPPSERMMQILHNARLLCSPIQPAWSPERMVVASRCILSDAEHLLMQDSTTFRMALQCVFAVQLVVLYTPCPALGQQAETMFRYWHSRLTL